MGFSTHVHLSVPDGEALSFRTYGWAEDEPVVKVEFASSDLDALRSLGVGLSASLNTWRKFLVALGTALDRHEAAVLDDEEGGGS